MKPGYLPIYRPVIPQVYPKEYFLEGIPPWQTILALLNDNYPGSTPIFGIYITIMNYEL